MKNLEMENGVQKARLAELQIENNTLHQTALVLREKCNKLNDMVLSFSKSEDKGDEALSSIVSQNLELKKRGQEYVEALSRLE